jgi:hypothetical protein
VSGRLTFADWHVDGSVYLDGTTTIGGSGFRRIRAEELSITGFESSSSLGLEEIDVETLSAGDMRIEGGAFLTDAEVGGTATLVDSRIGGSLFLRFASFGDFDASGADINGSVEARNVEIPGGFRMHEAEVGESIQLWDANLGQLELSGLSTGSSVNLGAASILGEAQLTGAFLRGDLILGAAEYAVTWGADSVLDLNAVSLRSFIDSPEAWPPRLRLSGLEVHSIVRTSESAAESDFGGRSASWYLEWLRKQDAPSPQPYQSLEEALRSIGRPNVANELGYARRDLDLRQSTGIDRLLRFGYRTLAGYGYKPERIVISSLLLIILGWFATLGVPSPIWGSESRSRLVFSLDKLLPIISLDTSLTPISLFDARIPRYVSWYFVAHSILGFVLAGFLVATISTMATAG